MARLLRGGDVDDLRTFHRQGLSISEIHRLTGFDRKTIRKYLQHPERPRYGPRTSRPSKLESYKPYVAERLGAGVWNARVLLRELRARGYAGGYTILTDYLRPQRQAAWAVAVRRFETPPGQQAQVDWGQLGTLEEEAMRRKVWGFVFTLGYSRAMTIDVALDQQLGTFLRLGEVQEHRVPADLAALIGPQPYRLDAIVENLRRHSAQLMERLLVHRSKPNATATARYVLRCRVVP